jgi:TolA-binding protein
LSADVSAMSRRTFLALHRVTDELKIVGVTVILLCVFLLAPAGASEQQARFFEQLRARQLFGLAERYCLEELNRTELPPHQRIQTAYELSRTLAQHALVVPYEEQAEYWTRATLVLDQARKAVGDHQRTLLLDLQAGFIPCAEAQALRWQLELTPEDAALRKTALDLLSTGIEILSALEPVIKEKIVKPVRKDILPRDKFGPPELRELLGSLQFELGQAYFEQAGLLSTTNAERFTAIDQAEKWLGVAARSDRSSEISQTCQIQLAGCARLKINAPLAFRLLDQVDAAKPVQTIADQSTAERARVLMMQKQPADAADLLTKALKNRQPQPGELVALRIQVLIDLWRAATEKQAHALAKELDAELDKQLETLKATNPGYWPVYCEALIATARDARSLGAELADQIRLYAAKRIPEAVAVYVAASTSAASSGKPDLAFDLSYTRGSIEVEAGFFAAAAGSFADAVAFAPKNARVADAKFLAAYALGQVYSAQPSKGNREAYITALETQRAAYPEHATAGEATWLLAQLEEKRLQNSAAVRLYQEIPSGHARAGAAAAASARCYDLIITRLRELKQPAEKWEAEAETKLIALLPKEEKRSKLTEDQAALAVHLANIFLQSAQPAFDKADRLLEWIIRSARANSVETTSGRAKPSNDGLQDPAESGNSEAATTPRRPKDARPTVSRWQELMRVATQLRVVSLAGQGRLPEAELSLESLSETSPTELLTIISGLSKLVAQAQDKPRHELGELQLNAALALKAQRDQLSASDQRRLDQCIVEAYVAAGRYTEAVEPYRLLAQASPKDPVILANLAQLLLRFGQPARTEEAQGVWKKVEGLAKPGSNLWFEVRLNLARCHLMLGQPDKGLKLIQVTKVLYPEPKSKDLSDRIEKLLQECKAATQK